MKIFLIVLVMMGGQGLNEDLYIIQEPNFNSVNQCIEYVQRNDPYLVAKAQTVYPGRDVENIYCVNKDKIQNLMVGV